MVSKFDNIKFNLMRAIELFEDLNEPDLNVTAECSSNDAYKEKQLAQELNRYLTSLIDTGFFSDCDRLEPTNTTSHDLEHDFTNELRDLDELEAMFEGSLTGSSSLDDLCSMDNGQELERLSATPRSSLASCDEFAGGEFQSSSQPMEDEKNPLDLSRWLSLERKANETALDE